jgi:hypothetical protein
MEVPSRRPALVVAEGMLGSSEKRSPKKRQERGRWLGVMWLL